MSRAKGTILITGANGGLGSAIAAKLCSSPDLRAFHGIYAVRDAAKPTPALDAVVGQHPHEKLSLDLSQLQAVREAAASINRRVADGELAPIRALVLNAGYEEYRTQYWTEDGLDMTFVVNYLSHWLLSVLLLESMDRDRGRIVWISSWAHNPEDGHNAPTGVYSAARHAKFIRDDDLEPLAKGTWSANSDGGELWAAGYRRYGASKFCGVTTLKALQRRLDQDPLLSNISVLAVDPGAMATGIVRRSDLWLLRVFWFQIVTPILAAVLVRFYPNGSWRTTEKSAGDVVEAMVGCGPEPLSERPKGVYLNGSEPGQRSEEAEDEGKCEVVWRESVKYAGLKEGETVLKHWE